MQNVEEELNEILDFIDEERRNQKLTLAELGRIALEKDAQSHLSKILNRQRIGVQWTIIAKLINALGYRIKLEKKNPGS